jgi:hypothetical protein
MLKVYVYNFDDVYGAVEANTEDEAKEKVEEAYRCHGYSEYEFYDLTVKNAFECNSRFADHPDVVECYAGG